MFGPLLLVLAKYSYLPETYTNIAILKQVEKLINDSIIKENLISAVKEINLLLNIKPESLNLDLKDSCGPYCKYLDLSLDVPCNLHECPKYNKQFQWNCSKFEIVKENLDEFEISKAVTLFTKQITSNVLAESLPPRWVAIETSLRCVRCGAKTNLEVVTKKQVACKECISKIPGKKLALQLELEFGRPIIEILLYLVKTWHSIQEQAQVLGLSSDSLYELCEIYHLNPKKYKTTKDRYFSNPFHSRKKQKISIDGLAFRLYFHFLIKRKTQSIRLEILELNDYLLNSSNQFLHIRKLPLFNQTVFK